MAENQLNMRNLKPIDWVIGIVAVAAAIILLGLIGGALNLPIPSWVYSGIGAAIGVAIWFAILKRRKR